MDTEIFSIQKRFEKCVKHWRWRISEMERLRDDPKIEKLCWVISRLSSSVSLASDIHLQTYRANVIFTVDVPKKRNRVLILRATEGIIGTKRFLGRTQDRDFTYFWPLGDKNVLVLRIAEDPEGPGVDRGRSHIRHRTALAEFREMINLRIAEVKTEIENIQKVVAHPAIPELYAKFREHEKGKIFSCWLFPTTACFHIGTHDTETLWNIVRETESLGPPTRQDGMFAEWVLPHGKIVIHIYERRKDATDSFAGPPLHHSTGAEAEAGASLSSA